MSDPGPEDSTAVLHLRGVIDFFTEDNFRAEAEQLLADPSVREFVVDLSGVELMDSSGLSLLVDLLRLCRDMELPMTLRRPPEQVVQLLDLTGLDQVIAID